MSNFGFFSRPLVLFSLLLSAQIVRPAPWSPVVVRDVKVIGIQKTPNITKVSRDGGVSVLLNGKIIWLYADTECLSRTGKQLSFVSNTGAYAAELDASVTTVQDGGLVLAGHEKGQKEYAILADKTVGDGGWVPFGKEEIDYNSRNQGKHRIAIWPGSSPTPINRTHAILYAPLVYVDSKPEDPAKKYMARGTTLISVTAGEHGPVAARMVNLLFPHDEIAYGGFAALIGSSSVDSSSRDDRDVYLLGMMDSGLQLARVPLRNITDQAAYTYFQPRNSTFSAAPPTLKATDKKDVYLPGTFTSGGLFWSPYFRNFIIVYFNRQVDSTFYIRFLDLNSPRDKGSWVWKVGGRDGNGVLADDVEALVNYNWSSEQVLYESKPGKGGFNYAGAPHAEYFNRHFYPATTEFALDQVFPYPGARRNEWYGSSELTPGQAGADGKHLLLSWTSQERGGFGTGLYQIELARLEFDDIPPNPVGEDGSTESTTTSATKPAETSKSSSSRAGKAGIGGLGTLFRLDVVGSWDFYLASFSSTLLCTLVLG
ncbi:MAG: hypothetical protein M1833_002141, partial [Piccolia ochrophora]